MPIAVADFQAQFIDTLTWEVITANKNKKDALYAILSIPPYDVTVDRDAETTRIGNTMRMILAQHKSISPLLDVLSDNLMEAATQDDELSNVDAVTIYEAIKEKYKPILAASVYNNIGSQGNAEEVASILNAPNDEQLRTYLRSNQKISGDFIHMIDGSVATLGMIRETARIRTIELALPRILDKITTLDALPWNHADATPDPEFYERMMSSDNAWLNNAISSNNRSKNFFGISDLPTSGLIFTTTQLDEIRSAAHSKANEITLLTIKNAIANDARGAISTDLAINPFDRISFINAILLQKDQIGLDRFSDPQAHFFVNLLTNAQLTEMHQAAIQKNASLAIENQVRAKQAEIARLTDYHDTLFTSLAAAGTDEEIKRVINIPGLSTETAGNLKLEANLKRNELFADKIIEGIINETNPNKPSLKSFAENAADVTKNKAVVLANKNLFDVRDEDDGSLISSVDENQFTFTEAQLQSFTTHAKAQLILIKAMQALDHAHAITEDKVAEVLGTAGTHPGVLFPDEAAGVKERLKANKNDFGLEGIDDALIDTLTEPQVRKLTHRLALKNAINNADPEALNQLSNARTPEEIREIIGDEEQFPLIANQLGLETNDDDRDSYNQNIISNELAQDLQYHAMRKIDVDNGVAANVSQRDITAKKWMAQFDDDQLASIASNTQDRSNSYAFLFEFAKERAQRAVGSNARAEMVPKLKQELTNGYNRAYAAREVFERRLEDSMSSTDDTQKLNRAQKKLRFHIAALTEGITKIHQALDVLEQPMLDNSLSLRVRGREHAHFDQADLAVRNQAVDAKVAEYLGADAADSTLMATISGSGYTVDPSTNPSIVTKIEMEADASHVKTNLVCAQRVKKDEYVSEIYGNPKIFPKKPSFLSKIFSSSNSSDSDIFAATTIIDNHMLLIKDTKQEFQVSNNNLPIGIIKAMAAYIQLQGYPITISYHPTPAEKNELDKKLNAHPEKYFPNGVRPAPRIERQLESRRAAEYTPPSSRAGG